MKKFSFLFIIFGFLFCFPCFASALTKEEMQTVEYKKVFEFERLADYGSTQGMIITDKYFVIASIKEDQANTALYVFDKLTYELVSLDANPIIENCFGHANDMAYNEKNHEIYIINNKTIFVLDDQSFALKSTKSVSNSYSGITLDEEGNFYFHDGMNAYQADKNGTVLNNFSIANNLTNQSIAYSNGFLYYASHEYGEPTSYQKTYDGVLPAKSNVIYVYKKDGTIENALYLKPGYGELEAFEFDQGIPYLLFNQEDGKSAVYKPDYKPVEQTIEVGLDQAIDPNQFLATLADEKGPIQTIAVKENKFLFAPISYSSPGIYKYTVKKTLGTQQNKELEQDTNLEEELSLTVSVAYNASKDSLEATVLYENNKSSFTVSSSAEEEVYSKEEIIENPDTGAVLPLTVLIVFTLGGLSLLFHKKKKLYHLQ